MPANGASALFHSNRYCAQAACEHCGGVVRHETWCITLDAEVYYAYQIVLDSTKLTEGDRIILHSLGVSWDGYEPRCSCEISYGAITGRSKI